MNFTRYRVLTPKTVCMLDELDQEVEMNFTRYRVLTQYYNTSFRIAKFEVEMNFTRYRVLTPNVLPTVNARSLGRNELHPLQGIDTHESDHRF